MSLSKTYSHEEIDHACQKAVACGAYRLKTIRKIIKQDIPNQQTMEFIDEHPIIRLSRMVIRFAIVPFLI